MGHRKYASDYSLEEHLDGSGRFQTDRVYRGKYYRFVCGPEQAGRNGNKLLLASALIAALLLPLLFNNTQMGRTFYVLLPVAFCLVPLYHLTAVGWRMRTYPERLTREEKDLTQERLAGTLLWLAGILWVTCIGCAVYWLRNGVSGPGEILCVMGVVLACGLATWLKGWKHLAQTEEIQ